MTGTHDGPSEADHAEVVRDHRLPQPSRPARLVGRKRPPPPERDGAGVGPTAEFGAADDDKDHMYAGEPIVSGGEGNQASDISVQTYRYGRWVEKAPVRVPVSYTHLTLPTILLV